MDLSGQLLGSYHIFDQVGRGRLGTVYRAYQPSLDGYVAIKVLAPELAANHVLADRILSQARASAGLRHPNILVIHDVVRQAEGPSYLVTDYMRDETLGDVLEREGKLTLSRALPIIEQLAGALDYAHERGVVHGDVRPANIFVGEGHVTLADFGLSEAACEAGRPRMAALAYRMDYLAPEQVRGEPIDYHADVYSLGVVAYELLTGRPPGAGLAPSTELPADASRSEPALHAVLPRRVKRVLEQALALPPDERWTSAGALAGALRQALMDRESRLKAQPLTLAAAPIYKEAPAPVETPSRRRSLRRWSLFWLALAVLVILAIVGLGLLLTAREPGAAAATSLPGPSATMGLGLPGSAATAIPSAPATLPGATPRPAMSPGSTPAGPPGAPSAVPSGQ